jgi:hypothetical protein
MEPEFLYRVFESPQFDDSVQYCALRTVSLLYMSTLSGKYVYLWQSYTVLCSMYRSVILSKVLCYCTVSLQTETVPVRM